MAQFFTNLLACMRKPFYGLVPLFPSGESLSWIPDGGTNIVSSFATEAPSGYVSVETNTFTFTAIPKYLIYNGQWLKPTTDFDINGLVVTMPVAVPAGAELYALI